MLVHATTVDIAGFGVLILGESGAGKSDLALRLIRDGALLVADDQTLVEVVAGGLRASAPASIAGLIEVRGVGVIAVAMKRATRVRLAVALADSFERMPEPGSWSLPDGANPRVPLIVLGAFHPSTPEKVRRALAAVTLA